MVSHNYSKNYKNVFVINVKGIIDEKDMILSKDRLRPYDASLWTDQTERQKTNTTFHLVLFKMLLFIFGFNFFFFFLKFSYPNPTLGISMLASSS